MNEDRDDLVRRLHSRKENSLSRERSLGWRAADAIETSASRGIAPNFWTTLAWARRRSQCLIFHPRTGSSSG